METFMLLVSVLAFGVSLVALTLALDQRKPMRVIRRGLRQNNKSIEELYAKLSSLGSGVEEPPRAVPSKKDPPKTTKTWTEFKKKVEGE